MALTTQQVETLYLAYLGRKGSAEEVAGWQTLAVTQEVAATGFYNSPEAQARGLTDNATYINQIYNDLFNRDAEKAGLDGWLQLLANGFPRDQIALAIANAALSNPSGADAQTLQAAISDVPPGPGPGPEPTPGATFMLTTGVDLADGSGSSHDGVADTFKFTNGNEKVVGDAKTLTAGDSLIDTGSGDTDILELSFELTDGMKTIGSKGVGSGATISGIEKLEIKGNNAAGVTFDNTAAITGLTTISFSGDTLGGFKFDGSKKIINGITTIEYTGVTGGSVTIDASKAKATQALTIEGSGVDASVTAGAGNDTITGQGSINAGDGNDTIVLTGAATVDAGKGNDVIDAANVGVDVTGISIDAGSGDDVITVAAAASIEAGAGNDVIDASKYTGVDDAEAITINAGNGDDIITVGGNANVTTGSGKDIITTVDGYAGTLTVTDFETGDILNLTGGTGNITVGAAGYEGSTLKVGADATLILNGSAASIVDISKATIAEGAKITINSGTGIVGSNFADIITGDTNTASVTGGKGADEIDVSTGTSTKVIYAASGDTGAATNTPGASGKLGTFTVGEDIDKVAIKDAASATKIKLGGEATTSSYTNVSSTTFLTSSATLSDYTKTGLDAFVYSDSGKTYLIYETTDGGTSGFGNLEAVKITGTLSTVTKFAVSATGEVTFASN